MEHYRRHVFLWKLIWWPVRLWLFLRINYRPKVHPIPAPSLIVSNHCTDLDPLLLALTIKNHAYFIASEHIFHRPRTAKLLLWLQAPIARMKSATGGDTALAAIRRMRKGRSVAVFAEGNRTFNGVTEDIVESTAKLARVSGASLVTHRFRGGYLTSPRWSGASLRRGLLTGEVVHVYSPAQLKAMTPAQIAEIIRRDIHEDAYATQEVWKIPYKGRNLAQYLERALCICPGCGALGALHSRGDTVSCSRCGLTAVYSPLGYLTGKDLPFRTVTEWDLWETGELQTRTAYADGQAPIAEDDEIDFCEVTDDYRELPGIRGSLRVFRDRIECAGQVLSFAELTGISINGPQALSLTLGSRHFQIRSRQVRNMRKYLTIYRAAIAQQNA